MESSLRTRERLKNYIKREGLTLRESASKVGVDINTLNTILYPKGEMRYDTEQHLIKFLRNNETISENKNDLEAILPTGDMNETLRINNWA